MRPRPTLPAFNRRDHPASTLTLHGWRITPIGRVTRVAWPGGALVYAHPVAVMVERDGQTRRVPIRDATRLIIGAILFAGASAVLLARWYLHTRKRSDT